MLAWCDDHVQPWSKSNLGLAFGINESRLRLAARLECNCGIHAVSSKDLRRAEPPFGIEEGDGVLLTWLNTSQLEFSTERWVSVSAPPKILGRNVEPSDDERFVNLLALFIDEPTGARCAWSNLN